MTGVPRFRASSAIDRTPRLHTKLRPLGLELGTGLPALRHKPQRPLKATEPVVSPPQLHPTITLTQPGIRHAVVRVGFWTLTRKSLTCRSRPALDLKDLSQRRPCA